MSTSVRNSLVCSSSMLRPPVFSVPAGIVAIIYAAQVNSKLAAGDVLGAQASARLAKIWSWVGFGGGILLGILYAIFGFAGALSSHH